jgi:uncharacterized protein YlaI
MHKCTKCGELKDRDAYAPSRLRNRAYICRPCDSRLAKVRNQSPEGKAYLRNWSLVNKYGITAEEFDSMLAGQGGVCAICAKAQTHRALDVDHCHDTGQVRALLCAKCNKMIGLANHDAGIMEMAAAYLSAHGTICHNDTMETA